MTGLTCAIDPGAEGAIDWTDGTDTYVERTPWIEGQGPDVEAFRSRMLTMDRVFIEELGVRPGQSAQATKTAAINWGRMEGICMGLSIPVGKPIRPQTWSKALGLPQEKDLKKRKAASVALAQRLYPTISLVPEGCRVPSDGMAEALLILTYAVGPKT